MRAVLCRWRSEAQTLPFQVQAFARDAERLRDRVDLAVMLAERGLDHLAFDAGERRHELVVQRHGDLFAVDRPGPDDRDGCVYWLLDGVGQESRIVDGGGRSRVT